MRCVALRCVALRCGIILSSIKSSKKRDILGKGAGKASFCEMFHFAQRDKSISTMERDLG